MDEEARREGRVLLSLEGAGLRSAHTHTEELLSARSKLSATPTAVPRSSARSRRRAPHRC